MLCRLILIVGVVWSSISARAWHEIHLSQFTPSDPIIEGEWDRLVFPMKRNGNLMLLEGRIDSIQGDFIIDTGAPYLVLSASYFQAYAVGKQSGANGIGAEVGEVQRGFVDQLSIGPLGYKNVDCDIVQLGQLENKLGAKVLGLLGTNLFSEFKIFIDVNRSQLIVYRKNEMGEISLQPQLDSLILSPVNAEPDVRITFKWCDNKIFMPVTVGGVEMNWMLDTGAESNVIDAMVKKKALKEFNIQRRITLTGTGGSKQDVFLGTLNEMNVGNQVFEMQATILTGMKEMNEACSVFVDGILGFSFYSQGVFSIDFNSKEFCLYLYKKNE